MPWPSGGLSSSSTSSHQCRGALQSVVSWSTPDRHVFVFRAFSTAIQFSGASRDVANLMFGHSWVPVTHHRPVRHTFSRNSRDAGLIPRLRVAAQWPKGLSAAAVVCTYRGVLRDLVGTSPIRLTWRARFRIASRYRAEFLPLYIAGRSSAGLWPPDVAALPQRNRPP